MQCTLSGRGHCIGCVCNVKRDRALHPASVCVCRARRSLRASAACLDDPPPTPLPCHAATPRILTFPAAARSHFAPFTAQTTCSAAALLPSHANVFSKQLNFF
ncbi:unnamed protein product, partial [Brenthis ino]